MISVRLKLDEIEKRFPPRNQPGFFLHEAIRSVN